jgi:hypothetical protein
VEKPSSRFLDAVAEEARFQWRLFARHMPRAFVEGGWRKVLLSVGLIVGSIGLLIFLTRDDGTASRLFYACLDRQLTKYAEEHHIERYAGVPNQVQTDAAEQCADELQKRNAQTETK